MSSLETSVLRALVGEARLSLDSARLLLDEARATAADFTTAHHGEAFTLLESRVRQRRELDAASVLANVTTPGGARALLAEVLSAPELGVLAERLAMLRDAAIRRRAIEALRVAAKAVQAGESLTTVAERARDVLPVLDGARGRVRETRGDTMAIFDQASATWTELASGGVPALRTGWRDLDDVWRLLPSLHVVGAHPGVGKSALIAGLVRKWTAASIRVGVLAYEDDAIDMQRRILACDADISLAHLLGFELVSADAHAQVERAAMQRMEREPYLLVDDAPGATIADAIASARELHARGARVILLDNMTCVRLDGDDERHIELEDALIRLRAVATSLRVPIVVVGHLKRGQGDGDELTKRPKLTDFAGAAAWERTCRSAIGMWREGDDVCARILKQTNGVSGVDFTLTAHRPSACVVGVERRVETEQPLSVRRYERKAS